MLRSRLAGISIAFALLTACGPEPRGVGERRPARQDDYLEQSLSRAELERQLDALESEISANAAEPRR